MATKSICTIDGCGKLEIARGFCSMHYQRWRIHGSPIGGGTPWGEPERYYQEVVLAYDGTECLIWPYARGKDGRYATIRREVGTTLVHRRLCEEVNGPPPTPAHEAAHNCGNGHLACVAKRHLDWKTRVENQADRVPHDTHKRGERNWRAGITEETARKIRSLKGKKSQRKIAAMLGLGRKTVEHVLTRHTWDWLE